MSLINVIFTNILSMSTIASIVFIITLAFRKILQNKITSSKQCLLWIVFVCTLIFPINFSSRLSIKNLGYESPKENVIIDFSKTILKILAINNGISYPVPNICGKKEELERRFEKMKNKKVDNKFGALIIAFAVFSMSLITISLASERYNNLDVEDANTNVTNEIITKKENDNELVYVKPLSGAKITSRFDKTRTNPVTGESLFHTGVDVVSDETDEIVATADGKVIFADYNGTRGNTVKIEHADGNTSVYSHGSKILVKAGDSVKAGDVIMTVGSTGMATGPHLHFEIINAQGEYVDVNQMFESK